MLRSWYHLSFPENTLFYIVLLHACRCNALDEIGDKSSPEERSKYFKEVDTDRSDGVDLDEFLQVIELS